MKQILISLSPLTALAQSPKRPAAGRPAPTHRATDRPNIILIMTDAQGLCPKRLHRQPGHSQSGFLRNDCRPR
ncbi:MAG: hypothetical protein LH606_18765 [Cytophagaceae bacterium]|nr:hypothetical protein [Cytophagaceae bacterium]